MRRVHSWARRDEEPVDVAVVLVGAHRPPALYDAAREKNVKYLVIIGDLVPGNATDGPERRRALLANAADGGPRILGPECAGF